jgi:DNA repair protein RecN (Recombination protein N)
VLAQLTIRNFALVDSVTLEFARGFNVLTGETGAGKSILIDALTAALGERVGAEAVRVGADRATIEAVFEVGDYALPAVQEAAEEGVVILAREISASGRSVFRVNGRMSTAGALRELAADLIDIHGQHDHQSLLSPERHVDFLDAWAGAAVQEPRRRVREAWDLLRDAHRELRELDGDERERARLLDLCRFQLQEIDDAAPDPDEEAELARERDRLANAERLTLGAAGARAVLAEGDANAGHLIRQAARELDPLTSLDPALETVAELLEAAGAAVDDAASELRRYLDLVEASPERLEQIQERLETYRQLKRKYGATVAEVLEFRERIARELEGLSRTEERRGELEAAVAAHSRELEAAAAALFTARKAAAGRVQEQIAGHLGDLSMAGTRFAVELVEPAPAATALERGLSAALGRCEFLISANPGEPLRPLARIASGGEMSRVMLALKTAMAGSHPVALIFDEIDAGVGGKTAEALGAKMAQLGASNQVLCVTHLSQIASLATRHFGVSKAVIRVESEERTTVAVAQLEGEARVDELARMLGGAAETALQHARRLLAMAADGPA